MGWMAVYYNFKTNDGNHITYLCVRYLNNSTPYDNSATDIVRKVFPQTQITYNVIGRSPDKFVMEYKKDELLEYVENTRKRILRLIEKSLKADRIERKDDIVTIYSIQNTPLCTIHRVYYAPGSLNVHSTLNTSHKLSTSKKKKYKKLTTLADRIDFFKRESNVVLLDSMDVFIA